MYIFCFVYTFVYVPFVYACVCTYICINVPCVFLFTDNTGAWSGDGVTHYSETETTVVCLAYHLSVFGILQVCERI